MEKKDLLQYIQDAITIETDVATQTEIIAQSKADIAAREPSLKQQKKPKKPVSKEFPPFFALDNAPSSIIPVGLAVVFFLFGLPFLSSSLVDEARNIAYGFWGVAGALLCFSALKYFQYNKKSQEFQAEKELQQKRYTEAVARVDSENAKLHEKYSISHNAWQQSGNALIAHITPPLAQTQELLTRHYADNTIYPKYRNLPALTSIYEYLITGRCEELTGPHGAYNLYEDELRKDTVISQLNTVIENLEKIRQNQYMLYQQVKAIQENTTAIASELRQIKGYTIQIAQLSALNAYYAALNERNTRITMYYHL